MYEKSRMHVPVSLGPSFPLRGAESGHAELAVDQSLVVQCLRLATHLVTEPPCMYREQATLPYTYTHCTHIVHIALVELHHITYSTGRSECSYVMWTIHSGQDFGVALLQEG